MTDASSESRGQSLIPTRKKSLRRLISQYKARFNGSPSIPVLTSDTSEGASQPRSLKLIAPFNTPPTEEELEALEQLRKENYLLEYQYYEGSPQSAIAAFVPVSPDPQLS